MGLVLPIYYPLMSVALPIISESLRKYIEPFGGSADLVHNVRIGREPLSLASYRLARQRGIPFVLTPVHHPRWEGRRYEAYNDLYRRSDALLALTEAEVDVLVDIGVERQRIHVIGMGPILEDTAYPENFLNTFNLQAPVVLFLGQHYEYKGFRQVLESAKYVWRKVPETNFVFVGPAVGQSEKAFAMFKDPRIHRIGHLNLQQKTNALAACSLLCVPSSQESFGGVYTEAWSFRKPVIGCPIPAVREVVSDGVDGYLVAQDPEEIADRICVLLLDSNHSQTMGEAGKSKVEKRYTWEKIANRTEKAYLDVL
jgi:glycosyltransferase involved in cell wall biosynthesis